MKLKILLLILSLILPPIIKAQDSIPVINYEDIVITLPDTVDQSTFMEQDFLVFVSDSLVNKNVKKGLDLKFHANQLIVPVSLIAVGTFGYYSKAFHKLNRHIQKGMNNLRGDHYFHYDDWIQYMPAAGYLALGFWKNKRKLQFKERILVEATAYLSMTAIVNIAKYSFKEKRPDSDARNSFPSGHTATAFTGAELIRAEFGWGMGSIAYAVSTGVAFLRLYNNRHWFNDVIAGAGIGILSARIGYWMLPLYRKWFHWENKDQNAYGIISPVITPSNFSLSILVTF